MSAPHETKAMPQRPAREVIVRLEYELVREDGELPTGGFIEVDGICRVGTVENEERAEEQGSRIAHWALYLFPRDADGTVNGWFILFPAPCPFVDALPGMCLHETPVLH